MKKYIIYLIVVILLYFYLRYMFNYYSYKYKFKRSLFFSESYEENNKIKYLKKDINDIEYINNPLFQTYKDKSKIPLDVYDNIKQYAPEYTHIVMDDSDILVFLSKYYNDNVIKAFKKIRGGSHKADLARYCLLYIYGGLYLDICKELIKPLREIFNKGDDVFYSCINYDNDHIHQGIIKSPKNNPIFLSLIDYIVNIENPDEYLDFCRDLYVQIESDTGNINKGLIKGKSGLKYYLFKEKCRSSDNIITNFIKDVLDMGHKEICYDGIDKHGKCCFIFDGNSPIIKSRRSSYPW